MTSVLVRGFQISKLCFVRSQWKIKITREDHLSLFAVPIEDCLSSCEIPSEGQRDCCFVSIKILVEDAFVCLD